MSNANGNEHVLKVEGMSCGHCVSRVQKALADTPGVLEAAVDLDAGQATIRVAEGVDTAQLISVIENAGYTAQAA